MQRRNPGSDRLAVDFSRVLGAVALGACPPDALLCQPGTHNKWVEVAGGRITAVRTGKPLRWALAVAPELLVGRLVQGVRRRGKYLLIDLDTELLERFPVVVNEGAQEAFVVADADRVACPCGE